MLVRPRRGRQRIRISKAENESEIIKMLGSTLLFTISTTANLKTNNEVLESLYSIVYQY
jgi:hypothetical protein